MESHDSLPINLPAPPLGMREQKISDAERSACTEILAEHFADGRLSSTDYEQRIRLAMVAVSNRDLARLTVDLPRLGHQPQPPAIGRIVIEILLTLGLMSGWAILGVIGLIMVIAGAANWGWMMGFSLLLALGATASGWLATRHIRQRAAISPWLRRR